jgi:hypothetical protein
VGRPRPAHRANRPDSDPCACASHRRRRSRATQDRAAACASSTAHRNRVGSAIERPSRPSPHFLRAPSEPGSPVRSRPPPQHQSKPAIGHWASTFSGWASTRPWASDWASNWPHLPPLLTFGCSKSPVPVFAGIRGRLAACHAEGRGFESLLPLGEVFTFARVYVHVWGGRKAGRGGGRGGGVRRRFWSCRVAGSGWGGRLWRGVIVAWLAGAGSALSRWRDGRGFLGRRGGGGEVVEGGAAACALFGW